MISLRDLQRRLAASVLGDAAEPAFASAPVPGRLGLQVHRDNVLGGMTAALATQYPMVRAVVGEAFFAAMAREFVRTTPPVSPVMIGYGATFSAFLASFPPAQTLSYLPDLARLEFLMHEAFHAADQAGVDAAALAGHDAEELGRLSLQFHASVRLIASDHPVDLIWRFNQPSTEQSEPVVLLDRPSRVMIARPDTVVEMTILSEPAFRFLVALEAGETLADAQDRAGDSFDGAGLLLTLFARGLVTDIIL